MKILYYDCFAGISGDMNLAAMIDLGVPADYLENTLKKLNLEGFSLKIEKKLKMGISGISIKVIEDDHTKNQHHRSFKKIKDIINNSDFDEKVKKTSLDIFEKVAIAEAKIHSKNINDVHFHEVGAIDSIVDIVGAAICYHYLKPDTVMCSTIELGGGFVTCAHGKFPVPAPATVEILQNIPIKKGSVQFETTTPTGAAILSTLVDEFTDKPVFKIHKTSYGIGQRDMDIPNVLRVHIAEKQENISQDTASLIECNIDDMPAEQFEYLMDRLFENGAHDVFFSPIIMKKSRPATKLSVLCAKINEPEIQKTIFTESTTLGIRTHAVIKTMLNRDIIPVETKFGTFDVKVAEFNGRKIKYKPEYEQCKIASVKNKIPIRIIIDEVTEIAKKKIK